MPADRKKLKQKKIDEMLENDVSEEIKLGNLFGQEEIPQISWESSKQIELTPDTKQQPLPPGELPKDKARVC